jgi:signal transduction histidine kinase
MLGVPRGVWSWRRTTLLLLIVAVPYAAAVALTAREGGWAAAGLLSGLLASAMIVGASGLLYLRWRIAGDPRQGWLLLVLTAWALDATTRSGLRALQPEAYDDRAAWLLTYDVLVAVGAVAILLVAQRVLLTRDPLPAGLALGVLVSVGRVTLALLAPEVGLPGEADVIAGATLLVLAGLIALALLRVPGVAEWARAGVALSLVLLSLGQVLAYHYPLGDARAAITIVTNLAGGLLLTGVTVALVLQTVRAQRREMRWLQGRLLEAEARQRRERESMHELAGTVAGIVSATRLLRGDANISASRREQLDQLVDAEITRLQETMAARHDERANAGAAVDLDEAIYPLVVALQARGNPVEWRPSGLTAQVRADDVSRAVNVLIDNVARHAPGSEAVIDVRRADESVEIHVADRGPGVPEEAREGIFDGADRGPAPYPVHGLQVAQRLVREQGGYLRLADTPPSQGAEFVIGFPVAGTGRRDRRGARRTALAGSRPPGGATKR